MTACAADAAENGCGGGVSWGEATEARIWAGAGALRPA